MGANTEIRKVVVRCFYHQEAGVYPAKSVEVFVSDDGRVFMSAGTAGFHVPSIPAAGGISVREIDVEAVAAGRYVKISCKNNGLLPAWHNAPGVLGHLMLDEILVNP